MTGIRKGLQAEISRQPLNVFICMKNMGLWGENKAVEFLKAKNYTILARNYHSRFGEIDMIARKQNTIIVVEDFSNLIVDMAAAKHPASSYEAPLFRM